MEKLQELVEVKMEFYDDLPYRAALVPQVEDLGLERFVLVDVGHGSKSFGAKSSASYRVEKQAVHGVRRF
jgi:hypothetical protein